MKYRTLGKTGLRISELVFGAGAVGGILINPEDETKRAAVRKALEGGVNWIDTAPSYGNGKSEESLGWLLKEVRQQPHISTKFRIDPEAGDIPGQVEQSVHASLKRLQRGSVDLLQLHNAVTVTRDAARGSVSVNDVLGRGGVLDCMTRMRDQKLTAHIGFTALGDTAALHRLVESHAFCTAQVYHNLLNPSAGRAVPAEFSAHDYGNIIGKCATYGVGVLNIRALSAGAIVGAQMSGRDRAMSPGSDATTDEQRAATVREAIGSRHGTMAQVAVRYCLANTSVSGVLVGFSTLGHIGEALQAVEMGPLDPAVMQRLGMLHDTDFGRLRLPA